MKPTPPPLSAPAYLGLNLASLAGLCVLASIAPALCCVAAFGWLCYLCTVKD